MCWSLAPGVAGPCPAPPPGVPYEGSFTPEEIAQYPDVLNGMNPQDVLDRLGGIPQDFEVKAGQSESLEAGPGWVLHSRTSGGITIRWSPGSARPDHPSTPYWRVSSGKFGKYPLRVPARDWTDGPPEFTQPGGGVDNTGSASGPCEASYSGGGTAVPVGCFSPGFGGGEPYGSEEEPDVVPEISYRQGSTCSPLN
jgi:hypothetical protein